MSLAGPVTIRYAIPPQREQRVNYENHWRNSQSTPEITAELVGRTVSEDPALLATLTALHLRLRYDDCCRGPVGRPQRLRQNRFRFRSIPIFTTPSGVVCVGAIVWFCPRLQRDAPVFTIHALGVAANRLPPSISWTWDELAADMDALVAAQPPDSWIDVAYLDTTLDTLWRLCV